MIKAGIIISHEDLNLISLFHLPTYDQQKTLAYRGIISSFLSYLVISCHHALFYPYKTIFNITTSWKSTCDHPLTEIQTSSAASKLGVAPPGSSCFEEVVFQNLH